ncbi:MAG: hypothetical protein HC880_09795, partial [Bacteroidia bacterium]|nr:hypothetical protein [Bacteroidia bacterium]
MFLLLFSFLLACPIEAQEITSFRAHAKSSGIVDVDFSPDGNQILTAGMDSTAALWDVKGTLLSTFKPGDEVKRVSFSPDGKWIATASGKEIQVWNAKTAKLLNRMTPEESVLNIAFGPDSKAIVVSVSINHLELWDFQAGKLLQTLEFSANSALIFIFLPQG